MAKQFYWEPEGVWLVLYASDGKTRLGHVEPGGRSTGGWSARLNGTYVSGSWSNRFSETKQTLLRAALGIE